MNYPIVVSMFFASLLAYLDTAQSKPCGFWPTDSGCTCNPDLLEIRCENVPALTPETLTKFGMYLEENFKLLYIHNTGLTAITANTFSKSFVRVFIENNAALVTVAGDSFQNLDTTKELVFKNNSITSDLTALICKTKVLQIIDFRANRLTKIPANSFNAANLASVAYISLDNQTSDGLDIAGNAFGQLTNLRQLSLDNRVITLGNNSIDLSKSNTSLENVVVFIENSSLKNWDPMYLTVPASLMPAIYLSLRGNNEIGDNIQIEKFSNLLSQKNNKLFVTNKQRNCDCKTVKELYHLNAVDVKVSGLVCDNFDQCLNDINLFK